LNATVGSGLSDCEVLAAHSVMSEDLKTRGGR